MFNDVVFKRRNDGRHRARLVAMGFRQIAGVDFHEAHAPVLHEVSLRLLLCISLKQHNDVVAVDIEKAFLESKLSEDIYIKVPKGLEKIEDVKSNMVCKLNKSVYGLVQAAKNFYKTIVDFLKTRISNW